MSVPIVKTIKLQGKDYAQVNDRLKAFHSQYPNGSIITEPNLTGEVAFVKAIVTPDVANPTRIYSASSYGTLRGVKAFEKLETVAVGRALAYLGFSIDGSIASAEEMEEFIKEQIKEPTQVEPTKPLLAKPTQPQLTRLHAIIGEFTTLKDKNLDETKKWLYSAYNIESSKDLSLEQYEHMTNFLVKAIATLKQTTI